MVLQGIALVWMAATRGFAAWMSTSLALGVGTALVYPTLLAAVGDLAHPSWRGAAIGVYRLWRDSGYVVGALVAGVVADRLGIAPAIAVVGGVTIASGLVVAIRMREPRTERFVSRSPSALKPVSYRS
jgi:MFS family permease